MKKSQKFLYFLMCVMFISIPMISYGESHQTLSLDSNQELPSIPTNGYIELVALEQQDLHIKGSAYSFSSYPTIDRFKIQISDFSTYVDAVSLSPAIQGFDVLIPHNSLGDISDCLIKITPMIHDQMGYPLYYFHNSSLPLPSQSEVNVIGGGNLIGIASHFLGIMIERCGLKPTDNVLEVGCGLGRMAYPLTAYLAPNARFEGFDIVPFLIQRASQNITPSHPNFNFQLANIYNGMYNPQGNVLSTEYIFPYANNSFDFVLLTSVFTHMLPEEVKHYLKEIHRVLRPGGKCLMTFFLLDSESQSLIEQGKSSANIRFPHGNECYVAEVNNLEAVVGYRENQLFLWILTNFQMKNWYKGHWCGRTSDCVSFQDILFLTKTE